MTWKWLLTHPSSRMFQNISTSLNGRSRSLEERFIFDAGATTTPWEETFDAWFLCTNFPTRFFFFFSSGASTNSVDVHDAVEESPKENVGEQSAEQSRREERSATTQEAGPGVHGAEYQHEPESQRCGEVEEESPEARQAQDPGCAARQGGEGRAAVFQHCAVVPHGSLAVGDRFAGFFLLGADFAAVLRHRIRCCRVSLSSRAVPVLNYGRCRSQDREQRCGVDDAVFWSI